MRNTAHLWVSMVLSCGLFGAACAGAPKQAAVPEIAESSGEDMAGHEAAPQPKADDAPAPEAASDMHEKCCAACKEGLAKDRTGAKPDTIPCADFTDTLTPWCLEHFRSTPTMASACK
jgi:hypothetical protein